MTLYDLLQDLDNEGKLKPLLTATGLSHLKKWMDIHAFTRTHPQMSLDEISRYFNHTTKSTVHRAKTFMDQDVALCRYGKT